MVAKYLAFSSCDPVPMYSNDVLNIADIAYEKVNRKMKALL
jgi:hypothetical protein